MTNTRLVQKIAPALSTYALVTCAASAWAILFWNSVSSGAASDALTIGAVLPLTGEAAHWGIPPRNAAEMAVDELNGAGGVGGRKLALVVEDDRCQPADGIAGFNKIMAVANPPAILGAVCSGVTWQSPRSSRLVKPF